MATNSSPYTRLEYELVIGYLDESTYSFKFLFQHAGAFIFYTLLFSVIPLALYHILLVTRAKRRAFLFAILCYVPLLIFILSVLVERFTGGKPKGLKL
ncbi:MAG: hypothetical protein ABIR06_04250 [Cyclobacteriaceae bacterium]